MKQYVVKQYVDFLDPNPTISAPMEFWEAEELLSNWISETVDNIVQHSPYSITDEDLEHIYESESQLIQIEEVNQ